MLDLKIRTLYNNGNRFSEEDLSTAAAHRTGRERRRMIFADLHIHTKYSDGDCSPSEIVEMAKRSRLTHISVTDHDTLNGVDKAVAFGKKRGIVVLPGIEISAYDFREVHILGYCMDWTGGSLTELIRKAGAFRANRNEKIFSKLLRCGVGVTYSEFLRETHLKPEQVGRTHIARYLVEKNAVNHMNEAFSEYLGNGAKAYVGAERLTVREAVEGILREGGVPVLAHPKNLNLSESELEGFLKKWTEFGLQGMETNYFSHTDQEVRMFSRLAQKFGLIKTGGSDFHGNGTVGKKYFVPEDETIRTLKLG